MPRQANGRTRTGKGPVAFAVLVGCLTAAAVAAAQEADSVTVDVGECTQLESPEERFACYEARVQAELKERDSATGAAADPTGAVAAAAGAAEPEGPTDTDQPAQPSDASNQSTAAREEELPEIVGVIASLRETVPNRYVITLEDGQVWRQTYPERYPLRAGHRVTIRQGRWGSFRLTGDGLNGYIQVEQVR